MATSSQTGLDYPFRAENIFAEAYVVVVLGTNENQVDLPAAVTDTPLGVIQDEAAAAGDSVPVRLSGVTKIVANGAFSKGDHLAIAATTGRVDTVSGLDSSFDWGTATAQKPLLVALEAASAGGEIIEALIRPFYFPWA
jgi:Uncharacterized conserved protein (DUF2190)